MITVIEAKSIIETSVFSNRIEENKTLCSSTGLILAEDIYSPINMPPFRQSAMDGYALYLHNDVNYTIIDEIKAGDSHQTVLKEGEAVRIFTGAPVPDTANTVIMQEKVSVNDQQLCINGFVAINNNIRPLGEQVKKGVLALKKGTKLTSAAIGFLTSLGIAKVNVFKKPKIAIVATGNELVKAGEILQYGQIYESNTIMLQTALYNLGYTNVSIHNVKDDYNNTYSLLERVIDKNDAVLISGGISVGDYDFVGKALNELSVKQLFYKVKQKPGKPLFYGQKGNVVIFALPGNPAAALSCFYVYVRIALEKLSGNETYTTRSIFVKSVNTFNKKGDRAQFLKAHLQNNKVTILEGQSSAMLQTFALANALVYLPEDKMTIAINEKVEVITID